MPDENAISAVGTQIYRQPVDGQAERARTDQTEVDEAAQQAAADRVALEAEAAAEAEAARQAAQQQAAEQAPPQEQVPGRGVVVDEII